MAVCSWHYPSERPTIERDEHGELSKIANLYVPASILLFPFLNTQENLVASLLRLWEWPQPSVSPPPPPPPEERFCPNQDDP